jgi:hypothetical protein
MAMSWLSATVSSVSNGSNGRKKQRETAQAILMLAVGAVEQPRNPIFHHIRCHPCDSFL